MFQSRVKRFLALGAIFISSCSPGPAKLLEHPKPTPSEGSSSLPSDVQIAKGFVVVCFDRTGDGTCGPYDALIDGASIRENLTCKKDGEFMGSASEVKYAVLGRAEFTPFNTNCGGEIGIGIEAVDPTITISTKKEGTILVCAEKPLKVGERLKDNGSYDEITFNQGYVECRDQAGRPSAERGN